MRVAGGGVVVGMVAIAVAVFCASACASRPPAAAVEPEPPPLFIPPMPASPSAPLPSPARRPAPPPPPELIEPDDPTTMAKPGPMALPCRTDAECMTHRCNPLYGKCTFPCQSDLDCIPGAVCFGAGGAVSACVPKPP